MPADLTALCELEDLAFPEGDRATPRALRRIITSPSAAIMVASFAGDVTGAAIVLFRAGARIARLYSLASTCRGVGTMLLRHAEAVAATRGAKAMRLEVRHDNHRAIGLYRKAGYREIGVRPNYYCDGTDALRMEKFL